MKGEIVANGPDFALVSHFQSAWLGFGAKIALSNNGENHALR